MIIDCHGHYTTAPQVAYRLAAGAEGRLRGRRRRRRPIPDISDDDIRASIDGGQLKLMTERGIDADDLLAARLGDGAPLRRRGGQRCGGPQVSNDLIARVVQLYPGPLRGGLPAAPVPRRPDRSGPSRSCAGAFCELGFVGCNLNPDPSGGHWTSPPLTDRSWYPFYEAMAELDVPGHGARVRGDQPCFPRHRLALPERRHHRVHAAACRRTCSRTSRTCG